MTDFLIALTLFIPPLALSLWLCMLIMLITDKLDSKPISPPVIPPQLLLRFAAFVPFLTAMLVFLSADLDFVKDSRGAFWVPAFIFSYLTSDTVMGFIQYQTCDPWRRFSLLPAIPLTFGVYTYFEKCMPLVIDAFRQL